MTDQEWSLLSPAPGLQLLATPVGVAIRSSERPLENPTDLRVQSAQGRLARLLPTLTAQLAEMGLGAFQDGAFLISHADFASLENDEFDAFDDIWQWSPFSLELACTRWFHDQDFKYLVKFHLGTQPVFLDRLGSFVRRGTEIYRLDRQTFALLQAVDDFHALPAEQRIGTDCLVRFGQIKGLASEIGGQLDQFLSHQHVLVPPKIGLDVQLDADLRVTFVPRVEGLAEGAFAKSFLQLDDVDDVYSCALADGSTVRVLLNQQQREILKRMQRVRHVGGQERSEVLRNPYSVFDGVADGIEIDLRDFGPRVKGVGDFPFVVRPYLQAGTGVLEGDDSHFQGGNTERSIGLDCEYSDGTTERIQFGSKKELVDALASAEESRRNGQNEFVLQGKTIPVTEDLLGGLRTLIRRLSPGAKASDNNGDENRRYLLIYTNDTSLEFEQVFDSSSPSGDEPLPRSLNPRVELKPHQREGYQWLCRNFRTGRKGCLLADDMGLGKTLQTLMFLAWLIEKGNISDQGSDPEAAPWNPILVVSPVILLENEVWRQDMRRFFVNDGAVFEPCLTLHGRELKALRRAGAGRETVIGEPVLDLDALRQSRVVLTNYETVTNYQHSFARMRGRWTVVVTDEAQEHKTPNTKISHALKSLDPRFRIACTGTPVETRLLDIWNIFDFLQPGRLLGSASEFSKTFETATEDDGRRDEQPAPMPSAAAIANLRTTLRFGKPDAFLLRRAKTDVLVDLPTKQEHKLKCDLSPVQRDWHIELIARASSGGPDNHPFALINRLMRVYQHPALVPAYEGIDADDAIATCPKLALLVGQLRRIEEVHEKALIFVRSLDMQQLLANVLQAELSIDAEIINGASSRTGSTVSARQTRQGILARFRQRRGFDVLILSPDVAGIGLTLVEANHVFHYGRWWNPAKEAQANDRVFRIGQTRDVHVYQLICQDPKREFTTFDEKLDALIERRRRVASDFLAPMPAEADLERELLADVCGHVGPTSASPALRVTADGLAELSWDRFEALVAALWSHRGYRTILTPKCGDEGIDVVGVDSGSIDLIQCKHTSGGMTLDTDVLAEVTRAIEGFRAKRLRHIQGQFILRGVLVTNGQLTKAARRVAVERDIRIHDREDLAKLLASHSCTLVDVEAAGVRRLATMSDVQSYLASLRAK